MANAVKIQIPKSERQKLKRLSRRLVSETKGKAIAEIRDTAAEIAAKAKSNVSRGGIGNTGRLANSIGVDFHDGGLGARVGAEAHYAPFVEYGTAPHMPPIEPIKDWARLKLGDESAAFPVARKIAREGTEPQPFLEPAAESVKEEFIANLGKILAGLDE